MTVAAERSDGAPPKTRIFVSYSRKDMAFADRLEVALKARGVEPLIDRSEIYAFAARLWDADTGKAVGSPLKGHIDLVRSAAFSPDGKRIVTASLDATARLWDAQTGQPVGVRLMGHDEYVRSAAFSPDGKRVVTASFDKTARLWDAATGKPVAEPLRGHEDKVRSAAFSPDGKRIVTVSDDRTARLWDAETGKPIAEPLRGHERPVSDAMFSGDGRRIVTVSGDRTARVWNISADTQEFVGHAKAAAPRCQSAASRRSRMGNLAGRARGRPRRT
jgi:Tol biopolymer transport system component